MGNSYFKFKQFTVNQSQCAMKVGTDGVLLGAWADVGECSDSDKCSVLEIGAGSGVVSLIVAQRNKDAQIDSVEIDEASAIECRDNYSASEWSDRLTVYNESIQDFVVKSTNKYDYILSNPPYFNNSLKNQDLAKSVARHTDSLPYEQLAQSVDSLLAPEGVFSAIFPYAESSIFVAVASMHNLYCKSRMEVRGVPNKPPKRVLLQFCRHKGIEIDVDDMEIELDERHSYSQKYIELTKSYYLKF